MKSINVGGGPAGADADLVDSLVEEVKKLKEQVILIQSNFEIRIQKLEDEMPIKADKQDLLDLENKIIDKLR